MEKQLEILDLPDAVAELVAECELNGSRTVFARGGRRVAVIVSYDEYLALRDTVDLFADDALRHRLEVAERELARNAVVSRGDALGD